MSDVKEFTVDRSMWYRGNGGQDSKLLRRADGKRCCLGFLGEACGVELAALLEVEYPVSAELRTARSSARWPKWLFESARGYNCVADELAVMNDRQSISDYEREHKIASICAQHGVTVRFVDGGGQGQ